MNDNTRFCRGCGCHKSRPEFGVNRRAKDGLNTLCKVCWALKAREWRQMNPEKVKSGRQSHEAKAYQREYQQRWFQENKQAIYERVAANKSRNPLLSQSRQREYDRKCKLKNPIAAKMKASVKNARRRKLILGVEGSYSEEDLSKIFYEQEGRCAYCQVVLEGTEYHVDHYIPLSRGGSNWPSNLRISCSHCNLSKGAKSPEEFLAYLGRRDQYG